MRQRQRLHFTAHVKLLRGVNQRLLAVGVVGLGSPRLGADGGRAQHLVAAIVRQHEHIVLVTGELDITRKRFLGAHNALLKAFTVGGQVGKPRHRMFCQLL